MTLFSPFPTYMLTAQMDPLCVFTTFSSIDVELIDEDWAETFFSCKLYAHDGKVGLNDFREIVEEYMAGAALASMEMSVRLTENGKSTTYTLNVFYCSIDLHGNVNAFLNSRFLSLLTSKVTYPDCHERLSFFAQKDEDVSPTWSIVYEMDSTISSIVVREDVERASYYIHYDVDCGVSKVLELLLNHGIAGARILSYLVSVGARHFQFYVEDASPPVRLAFRNAFGTVEYLALFGVTTTKTEASHSEAICNHKALFYDRAVLKTYEVKTAPLPAQLAKGIDMLLVSTDVRIDSNLDFDSCQKILIDEHSFEIADADSELNTVSFTYRFVGDRPHVDIGTSGTDASRIFTNEFSKVFC